jgi:hypothetical protein
MRPRVSMYGDIPGWDRGSGPPPLGPLHLSGAPLNCSGSLYKTVGQVRRTTAGLSTRPQWRSGGLLRALLQVRGAGPEDCSGLSYKSKVQVRGSSPGHNLPAGEPNPKVLYTKLYVSTRRIHPSRYLLRRPEVIIPFGPLKFSGPRMPLR